MHGLKSWNAPDSVDQPLAYVQDHIFDSAYGINTSAPGFEPTYFGHSDMTELYSRSETAFSTPPPNDYVATVVGPDGVAFADFSATVSMYAYDKFQHVNSTCGFPNLISPSTPSSGCLQTRQLQTLLLLTTPPSRRMLTMHLLPSCLMVWFTTPASTHLCLDWIRVPTMAVMAIHHLMLYSSSGFATTIKPSVVSAEPRRH